MKCKHFYKAVMFMVSVMMMMPVLPAAHAMKQVSNQGSKLQYTSRFTFAVLGDSRAPEPVVQPDIFKTTIEELNILSPALVFDVGDMIMGYTDDEKLIAKEWNVFRNTVSALEAPFITVVGNHDIWNKKSEKFYRNLISDRRYFAFWYGGSRFIVLDTEIPGSMNRIEGKQLEWLKSELENNSSGADHVFVFMHKPLWGFNPKYTNWQSEVHPLLVASGVEYVFCGHWHSYNLEVRDGIHYIVTGGGGAELDQGGKQYGGFYHYLLVNVGPEKDDVRVAVVEPGHVYRQDVVLYDTSKRYYKLSNGIHGFPFVETPLKKSMNTVLTLANTFDETLSVKIESEESEGGSTGKAWKAEYAPSRVLLAPGEKDSVRIRVAYHGKNATEPREEPPSFTLVNRFTGVETPVTVSRDIIVTRVRDVRRMKRDFEADGLAHEWRGYKPVAVFGSGKSDAAVKDEGAAGGKPVKKMKPDKVRMAWTGDRLCILADIHDDIHLSGSKELPGDVFLLYFSTGADPRVPNNGRERLSGWRFYDDGSGGSVIPVPWLKRRMKDVPGGAVCTVRRIEEKGLTRYEGWIPAEALKKIGISLEKGSEFYCDMVVGDRDEENVSEPVVISWTGAMGRKSNTAYMGRMELR